MILNLSFRLTNCEEKQAKQFEIRISKSQIRGFDLEESTPYFFTMINITDNAVQQLRSLLAAQAKNSAKGLRVQIAKGGCSGLQYEMELDEKKDDDVVVERDGMQFFVDGESLPYLRGATLDFRDGLTGAGFYVVNPNASRTCGCGSSFETEQSA